MKSIFVAIFSALFVMFFAAVCVLNNENNKLRNKLVKANDIINVYNNRYGNLDEIQGEVSSYGMCAALVTTNTNNK